ncbi:unnamed protein product [Rotaria sordida]|uniref:G-protein coupled receptors family 1 profile domain-containing protein n=1 Tax=Rotaria sordida TaxID=392033 RepID=A0A814PJH8_9BILA|nr:unnamed protein product [Rotaria sordida]CAF4182750.1 unnamed protein product [Rotaria sordida]
MSFNYSSIIDEQLSRDDPLFWNRPTPVNCNTIRIMGIFLCIAAFIGIIFNGTLLYSFIRYKGLRSPPNIFVMFIVGIGLFASCTILPLTGTSSIYCQWLYNRTGCQLSAIVAFLYGCSSSYLLCGASLSRCYIIIRPFQAQYITVNRCIVISCIAIFIAFIWTMLPVIGWNEYTMEGARTSCCINWYDRRISYVSFLFFLFIVVYCIPLIILIIANTITMFGLKRMRKKIENGIQTVFNRKRIEMERRILKSIIITTSGFIFTWTPYAIIFFVSAFQGKDYAISPMATFFCACFAKTSVIWIPMCYVMTSTQFQLNFVNRDALDQSIGTKRIDATAFNASILPQKNGEIMMMKPITENINDIQPIATRID